MENCSLRPRENSTRILGMEDGKGVEAPKRNRRRRQRGYKLGREFGENRTTKPSRSQEPQALAVVGELHEFWIGQIPQLILKKKNVSS
jgi:hypothetical protein